MMNYDHEAYFNAFERFVLALETVTELTDTRIRSVLSDLCPTIGITRAEIGQRRKKVLYSEKNAREHGMFVRTQGAGDTRITCTIFTREAETDCGQDVRERIAAIQSLLLHKARKELEAELRDQTYMLDKDLGVYNQDYFLAHVQRLLLREEADRFNTVRFDIRGMTAINNRLGIENGTALMRAYVQNLQHSFKDEGFVSRISSDEFTAIFPKEKLESVVAYLSGEDVYSREKGIHAFISANAGYYVVTDNKQTAMEIMDKLNAALQNAKTTSSSNFIFYDEKLQEKISMSKWIESMFHDALKKEEFQVYYQPKIELRHYRLHGAEALCRWKHREQFILPFQFIPVLEQNGDICALDFYMLEHVCQDLRRWLNEGKEAVRISFNLSRCHLGDQTLLDHIISIIDRYNVPHSLIEVELTETTTDVNFADLREIVVGLREQGISTSVDDFGVGYSSMNLIRELPWNLIKIDKNFMPLGTNDMEDDKKMIMLRSVIEMAHALGLECIAEGVETVEQIVLLKESACFLAQGYYFDKPLPVADFETRLSSISTAKSLN